MLTLPVRSVSFHSSRRQGGFSLVELMVAAAVGLIILLAAMVFITSMLRSNNENIVAARVMQDVRTTHAILAREIKRAGFNRNALTLVSNVGAYNASFNGITTGGAVAVAATDCADIVASAVANASSCVIFAYDQVGVNDAATTPNGQEWKGFRRQVINGRGVVQGYLAGPAAGAPTCADAVTDANWSTLTSDDHDITRFMVVVRQSAPIAITTIDGATIQVRDALIQVDGRQNGSATGSRRLCESVRVRADRLNLPAP